MYSPAKVFRFKTDSGKPYVYDTSSGLVFYCPDSMYNILVLWTASQQHVLSSAISSEGLYELSEKEMTEQLSKRYSIDEILYYYSFIAKWVNSYGAFIKREEHTSKDLGFSAEAYWDELASSRALQLILIVTENCNLRCKYCVFSGHYQNYRSHNSSEMNLTTAKAAIDYFCTLVRSEKRRSLPDRVNLIGFYGGEPFLKFDLIRQCMEYAKSKADEDVRFSFVATTNGTILSDQIADYLARDNVHLAVSLDGPTHEHDKNRVYRDGRGSFDRVAQNLARIRKRYPGYFSQSVAILSTLTRSSNLLEIEGFFRNQADMLPPGGRVTLASERNTTFYDEYPANVPNFEEQMRLLRQRYYLARCEGTPVSPFLGRLFDPKCFTIVNRRSVKSFNEPGRYSATCVPGQRIAVRPDGSFHICEKINHIFLSGM